MGKVDRAVQVECRVGSDLEAFALVGTLQELDTANSPLEAVDR